MHHMHICQLGKPKKIRGDWPALVSAAGNSFAAGRGSIAGARHSHYVAGLLDRATRQVGTGSRGGPNRGLHRTRVLP